MVPGENILITAATASVIGEDRIKIRSEPTISQALMKNSQALEAFGGTRNTD
jgi:hypothetical protein